ncbi:MAG: hypothetical protein LBQ88_05115 [Treponema sp.]|jgi:hypothetical protein|nr:hypothetical protein [Treponema sp.]
MKKNVSVLVLVVLAIGFCASCGAGAGPGIKAEKEGVEWGLRDFITYLQDTVPGLGYRTTDQGTNSGTAVFLRGLAGVDGISVQASEDPAAAKDLVFLAKGNGYDAFSWGRFVFLDYENSRLSKTLMALYQGLLTEGKTKKTLKGTWEGTIERSDVSFIFDGKEFKMSIHDSNYIVVFKGSYTATNDNLSLKFTHAGSSLSNFNGRFFEGAFEATVDDIDITERQLAEINSLVETEDYGKLAAYLTTNFKQFFSVDKDYLWATLPADSDFVSAISSETPYFRFNTRLIMVLGGDVEEDDSWFDLTLKE